MPDLKSILQQAQAALAQAIEEKKRNQAVMSSMGPAIIDALRPVLDEVASSAKLSKQELINAIAGIRIDVPKAEVPRAQVDVKIPPINVPAPQVSVNVPDIHIPPIKIPTIRVPKPEVTVNVPPIKIPRLDWPADDMPVKGWLNLMGYDKGLLQNPLPVQLRDSKGNPMKIFDNITQVLGSGGGKADFFTIKGFSQSAYADLMNADNRLRVSVETGGSGLTDNELRAAHLDVQQLSGSVDSVYITGSNGTVASALVDSSGVQYSGVNPLPITGSVTLSSESITLDQTTDSIASRQVSGFVDSVYVLGAFGSAVVDSVWNADNRLRVSVETGGSGLTDAELRAAHLDVQQVSGSIDSVKVTGFDVSVAASFIDSSGVQYSGSNPVPITGSVTVSSSTNTTGASIIDLTGVAYEGANPFPITVVTSATATVNTALTDSGGVQYSGSNPVPITGNVNVNGSLNSVLVTGVVLHDAVDDGDAPVKVGGVAMQTNPTAVADGDRVRFTADDVGRQLVRPVQVRDLIKTAYASLTTGTETTLLAASAGSFHDLIYVMGANNSDVAVTVDIRPVLAGNIVMSIQVPANGTAGISIAVPYPQSASDTGNVWTADMADITGTTVYLSALFSREV